MRWALWEGSGGKVGGVVGDVDNSRRTLGWAGELTKWIWGFGDLGWI